MKGGTIFVRIVPADRDRGYVMLISWEKPVVQRTCIEVTSLGAISRATIDRVMAQALANHNAAKIVNVTDSGLLKKLAKMFGEDPSVE